MRHPLLRLITFGLLFAFGHVSAVRAQTAPVITSITPPRQVVLKGGSLTLNVTAANAKFYQWSRNNKPIPGATNSSYTITNAQRYRDDGAYTVRVTNDGAGVNVSVMATVYVLIRMVQSQVAGWGLYHTDYRVSTKVANVVEISASGSGNIALLDDGTVTTWETTGMGQPTILGLSGVVAVAAGNEFGLALLQGGTVVGWSQTNSPEFASIPSGLAHVIAIAAGYGHGLALKQDGSVEAWGYNWDGRASVPSGLSDVVSIAAGSSHSLALKQDGTVVAWGNNVYGQSSVPLGLNGVMAIAAGGDTSLALKQDRTVAAWGRNEFGQATVPKNISGVVAIATSFFHSLALKRDGIVIAWGYNEYGQITIPSGLPEIAAVAAGPGRSLVIYNSSSDAAPSITPLPSSIVANIEDRITFPVITASPFPPLQYQWRKNSVDISGATAAQYVIANAAIADAGSYDVVVSNYLGSVTSSAATLTVNPAAPAAIIVQPINVTANVGQAVTLSFTATGSPTPAVQWFKNGTVVAGATNQAYAIASATKADAATYTATVQNVYNGATYTLTTSPAILTVIAPPIFSTQPSGQVVQVGAPVAMTAAIQGLAVTTFQWRKNDIDIPGATNSTLALAAAAISDAGTYTVVATNSEGSTTSQEAVLVVNQTTPPSITTGPVNITIAANDRAELRITAQGAGPLSYQWYQGPSGVTSAPITGAKSASFITPALTATTTYWVRITDANGSVTDSPAVTVTVAESGAVSGTHVVLGPGYTAGGVVAVTNVIQYSGAAPSKLSWSTLLPPGWVFLGSGGNEGNGPKPPYKIGEYLEWTWGTVPASPIEFTYIVGVPAETLGDQELVSLVSYTQAGATKQSMTKPDPLVLRSASMHTADTNRDGKIGVSELTRVIQLYNHRSGTARTGEYHRQSDTADGFAPGPK